MPSDLAAAAVHAARPLRAEEWVQTPTVPVQCFRVDLVVHQEPGADRWCFSLEVSDPHTKELLGMVVHPAERYSQVWALVTDVTMQLRSVLLTLTDPEPF